MSAGQRAAAGAAPKRFAACGKTLGRAGSAWPTKMRSGSPPRRARWGLTCAVSKRVPRVYIEGGKIVERSLRLL